MKFATVVVLAVCLWGAVAEEGDEDSNVVELGSEGWDETIAGGHGVWLVEFYGPTCGFCKMLAPEWEKLAKEVAEDEIPMHVAKVNVREARDLSERYKIGKLPGIKLFRDGKAYTLPDARQGRSADDYIEYAMETFEEVEAAEEARIAEEIRIQKEIDDASALVHLDVDNFEDTVYEGNWLIEFYGPKCGYCKKLAPTWEELGFLVNTEDSELDFKVAKFDAAAGFVYTRQFKANPWPAIRLLRDGRIYAHPNSRDFELTLQDYVDWATSGYADAEEEEPLIPEFLEARRKRAARKAKWGKKKAKKAHDEL